MNEYLSELYDWISSQDNTFQGRRSREEFISKMQNDSEYNQQIYSWISGVDATFKNRYTTDAFQSKTGLKKKDELQPTSQKVDTESITKEEDIPVLSASLYEDDEESEIAKKLNANTRRIGSSISRIPVFLAEQVFTLTAPQEMKDRVNAMPAEEREDFIASLAAMSGPSVGAGGAILKLTPALTDIYQEQKDKIDEIEDTYKKYETSIGEDYANLDLGQALDRTFVEIIGGVPQLIQAMVPGVGLASIALGSAAEKSGDLQREGEDLGLKTSLNSIVSGAAEGIFEVVTRKLGKKLLDSFKINPEETLKSLASKLKEIFIDVNLEGGSEAATSIVQKLSDALIQGKDVDFYDALRETIDSYIIGAGTGGSLTGLGKAVSTAKNVAQKSKLTRKIKDSKYNNLEDVFIPAVDKDGNLSNKTDIDQVTLDIASSNVSRKFVVDGLNKSVKKGKLTREEADKRLLDFDNIREANTKVGDDIQGDDRLKSVDLIREKNAIQKEIENLDPALIKNKEARIKEINNELEQIANAIQEQETRDIPDVKPAEGVQEVETEVREPAVKTEKVKIEDTQKEQIEKLRQQEIEEVELAIARSNETGEIAIVKGEPVNTSTIDEINKKYDKELETDKETAQYLIDLKSTKNSDPTTYWSVSEVELEVAEASTIIDTEDGSTVVKPDGDIAGLFKKVTSKAKGVAQDLLKRAVEAGGRKLDNFDGYLTKQYEKAGFRVVARTPFNKEYAPFGWNQETHGTPDVVAMIYDPNNELDIEERMFDDPESGYDQMIEYRDSLLAEPKATKKEAEEVTPEVTEGVSKLREKFSKKPKLRKQVDSAKKALSKVVPDVEIIISKSEQDYAKVTGETGRKQKTGGTYQETVVDGKVRKVIYINPEKANSRTVAHEVFHAILLSKVKTDAEARRLTEAMMKAVSKVASPELKAYLDAFASNYDQNIRSEEKLAELVGKLASEYESLPQPTKNVIKRWLDRLAKMFGLKPFTDNEVIDVLNTIAGKVARGETITQQDLSSIQSNAKYVSQDESKLWGTVPERKQVRTKPDPKKTVKAYKMFRIKKTNPGKLFPLFVNANDEVLMNTWLDAEVGELTKDGKVKSKIGNLAYRPGWHMGDLPIATHIGDKYNFEKGEVDKSLKKPTARSANHVWAEVEVAADVNWQEEANKRAKKTKAGKIIPRTAHITDRIPSDGYYRYKTNPNMTGEWLIGGSIKVTKVLTDDEVKAINDEAGVADLPRVNPINLQELGFATKTSTDIEALSEGASTFFNEPTTIKRKQVAGEVKVSDTPADLSFITSKDVIDINTLIDDISSKGQKVWFWVADQLGRGMYMDTQIGREHFLDAGPSYALDPKNREKNIIWATGKKESEVTKLINKSDYIFIISGSPIKSKLFNKRVINILKDRVGNYKAFKEGSLNAKPIKPFRDVLEKHDSWESLTESPDRKKLLNAIESIKDKKDTPLKTFLQNNNAFIELNDLRDGFYAQNDFQMNDVMLVLKPTAFGGKSDHSTYENDILGKVVGVPNKKINAYDLMPDEVKQKYSDAMTESQKAQVVAPYGIGVKEITRKRKQVSGRPSIDDVRRFARENNISDADTNAYLKELGYTQDEIASFIEKDEEIYVKKENKVVDWLRKTKRYLLSAKGFLPKNVFIAKEKKDQLISAEISIAERTAKRLNKLLKNQSEEVFNEVNNLMTGKEFKLPREIALVATQMREHIDSLSTKLVESGAVKSEESIENIKNNLGSYLNRSYRVFDDKNWASKVSEEVVQEAKQYLKNSWYNQESKLQMAQDLSEKQGVSLDEWIDQKVDQEVNDIVKQKEANSFIVAATEGSKNLKVLKQRKEIPAEIRALMGEYNDPAYNYVVSVAKIINIVENQKFLEKIKDIGDGVFLFKEGEIRRGDDTRYVKVAAESNESLAPLNGYYMPKEIVEQLKNQDLITLKDSWFKNIYMGWLKAVGLVKKSKTIYSVGTHGKNVFGNARFMAQNGYLNPSDYNNAFKVLKNQFKGATDTELNELLDKYKKLGIINQSVNLNEIRSMFSGDDSFDIRIQKRMLEQTENKTYKNARQKLKNIDKFLEDMYQAEDDLFKIVAYENEKRDYSDILYDKKYEELTDTEKQNVDDYVSNIVKNILPNYSRIGNLGKGLKFIPVTGTFISFQIEAYRTAYNTVGLAINEIKSDNAKMRTKGAKRLVALMAVEGLKQSLLYFLGASFLGDDDEEEKISENDVRPFLPEWAKNSDIIVTSLGEGKFSYVNVSASDPYGGIFQILNAAARGEDMSESIAGALKEFGDPVLSQDIFLSAIDDIVRNKTQYGGDLIESGDDVFDKTGKIAGRLWTAFEPGTLTSIRKIMKSKEGAAYETIGQFTGLKPHNVDVNKILSFKLKDIKEDISNIKKEQYRAEYKVIDTGELGDLFEAYKNVDKKLDPVFKDANNSVRKAMRLGVSIYDIDKILSQKRFSNEDASLILFYDRLK